MKIYKQIMIIGYKAILVTALILASATQVSAHKSPDNCTGSGLQISLFVNVPQVHIGDTISYSANVFNGIGSGQAVCDATDIQAFIVTPDGVNHTILSSGELMSGESISYPNIVTYVARVQDVKSDGTLIATASDTGTIHQNDTDSPGGGDQGVNTTIINTLRVIKLVVNGDGGTAVPSDFTIHVKSAGTDVSGSPAPGTSAPGTSYSLPAGTYVVSENANASYVQSFIGDCDSGGNVTLTVGSDKICTVVNTDIPLPPPVIPVVVTPVTPPASGGGGGGGGGGGSGKIIPLIGILKVPTPLALPAGAGSVTYNYTVWNVGGQQALTDVKVVDDKCSPLVLLPGDLDSNGKLDPGEHWKYSCTATISTTTTNTAIATGYSYDAYRQIAVATAIATVVVGANTPTPLIPPLINITKVPSRLTPLPFGGDYVVYLYNVTNPGLVPLQNVTVTDDKCSPMTVAFGDTNGNNLLELNETWAYACVMKVTTSTRNIATAKGQANGLTAIGYAFATVLVSAPALPNTGLAPQDENGSWSIVVLSGIFMIISISVVTILKKSEI